MYGKLHSAITYTYTPTHYKQIIPGGGDARNTDNFQGNDNHNHQDNHTMNGAEEGENGEEHMYHILEKPGDDDYEDPDKDLEENTAIDYETPVPLKDI